MRLLLGQPVTPAQRCGAEPAREALREVGLPYS
jgi:hypothetical protein